MILYHYYHCPFCVRVRLCLGFLNLPYTSKALAYEDEKTPVELCGKKMLPILDFSNGKVINESLDIIQELDKEDRLKLKTYLADSTEVEKVEKLLSDLGSQIHNLAMPYWIYTKEFSETSRKYFQTKKEAKRGPFAELIKEKNTYLLALEPLLLELESKLNPYYESDTFRIQDVLIASHVWGMYIVPEFQFSPKLHSYLQNIKELCRFNYMDGLWSLNPSD